jgi:alpha-beta hydrolase superfamily lysophospholipase
VLTTEEVRFRAGDQALSGTLTLPPGDDRHPWALLVGSWLPRDRDGAFDRTGHPGWYAPLSAGEPPGLLARLAEALAGRGVASLRYDPRGCGDSPGRWEATDLFTRIDDARDAIGAMRSRRELDLRRTAIVGHGEGALIAASVAISDPAIGAIGLVGAPARSMRDVLRRGVAQRSRTGIDRQHPAVATLDRWTEELIERAERREAHAELAIADEPVTLRLAGLEQAIHTPLLALVTMLHRNVLLVHGTADAWADPDESALLADVLGAGGDRPELDLVTGSGHDLAEATDERIGEIAAALTDRIESRELPPVLVAIEQMHDDPG